MDFLKAFASASTLMYLVFAIKDSTVSTPGFFYELFNAFLAFLAVVFAAASLFIYWISLLIVWDVLSRKLSAWVVKHDAVVFTAVPSKCLRFYITHVPSISIGMLESIAGKRFCPEDVFKFKPQALKTEAEQVSCSVCRKTMLQLLDSGWDGSWTELEKMTWQLVHEGVDCYAHITS